MTAAPLNNIDKVRADGSHYSVRSGEYASGGLPAVPGVIGAGRLPGGQRVLFGSRCGTMAQYSVARARDDLPVPDALDDAVAAAAWNPGLSAWLAFGLAVQDQPGQTVLILGATGVTGKLAVQAARHFGAGRIIAAGRNQQVLDLLPELGADAMIQLGQPDDAVAAELRRNGGEHGCDVVVDYLWGRPTEIFLARSTGHYDAHLGRNGYAWSRRATWRARPSRCRPRCCAARSGDPRPGHRHDAAARRDHRER